MLCEICGREARHVCRSCNRSVCDRHYSVATNLCVTCASKSAQARQPGRGPVADAAPKPFVPSLCSVCNRDAKHVCRNCNRSVCDEHFDIKENLCVMCVIRRNREEMRGGP